MTHPVDAVEHPMPPYVAVCGAAEPTAQEAEWAQEIGRGLAAAGAVVVCGGLGGVMDAAARGAESAGGTSLGILPGSDRSEASTHLTVAIPTGLGEARNALVVRSADVVIAVGGEFGTLSEIALALKRGTPVVGLATWRVAKARPAVDPIVRVEDPQEAVAAALELARS
ncbi:MAG TPA: TIGR00725 family protein [Actinomycetota bacterium]|jgi:uncharacterized protein (TIGR00725 family)|nr:TIGR00725 family protein [Actinomycetota bacterium]